MGEIDLLIHLTSVKVAFKMLVKLTLVKKIILNAWARKKLTFPRKTIFGGVFFEVDWSFVIWGWASSCGNWSKTLFSSLSRMFSTIGGFLRILRICRRSARKFFSSTIMSCDFETLRAVKNKIQKMKHILKEVVFAR